MSKNLTVNQLMALRSLLAQGWPSSLLEILLNRCSLEMDNWQEMVNEGWVVVEDNKFRLSNEGKRVYNTEKRGKYF